MSVVPLRPPPRTWPHPALARDLLNQSDEHGEVLRCLGPSLQSFSDALDGDQRHRSNVLDLWQLRERIGLKGPFSSRSPCFRGQGLELVNALPVGLRHEALSFPRREMKESPKSRRGPVNIDGNFPRPEGGQFLARP